MGGACSTYGGEERRIQGFGVGKLRDRDHLGDSGVGRNVILSLNIPSLARQRCLPSWCPRRTPWFLCNFSTVWCGRLLKLCFLGFWDYNSDDSSIVSIRYFMFTYFNRSNRGHGTSPHSLITHPASEQSHLLSIVGGPFFKFTTFRT